jgi:hypothetical protein
MKVRYKIVLLQIVDGRHVWEVLDLTDDNVVAELGTRGFPRSGTYKGRNMRCAEFLNQPTFEGLAGPMLEGPGQLRYESWAANKALSADN